MEDCNLSLAAWMSCSCSPNEAAIRCPSKSCMCDDYLSLSVALIASGKLYVKKKEKYDTVIGISMPGAAANWSLS